MTSLTSDERRIVDFLLAGDGPDLALLRDQARRIHAIDRQWTGSGFFTCFAAPEDAPRLKDRPNLTFDDARGEVADFECGFILFVRHGVVDQLECYAAADRYLPRNPRFLRIYRPSDHPGGDESAMPLDG